jgi:hypothetical protein
MTFLGVKFPVWYDGWVGYFWDRRTRILYVCPLPWLVFGWKQKEVRDASDEG